MLGLASHPTVATLTRRVGTEYDARGFKKPTERQEQIEVFLDAPSTVEPTTVGASETDIYTQTLYAAPGTSINAKDKITINGTTYQVVGVSPPITNFFTGTTFYTEVKIRRVTT